MTNKIMTVPASALNTLAAPGSRLVNPLSLGLMPGLGGAETGFNQQSDVLITQSTDGIDYNQMWKEFQDTLTLQNAERTAIVSFLTFPVTKNVDQVSQLSGAQFERASEYGEPRGIRQTPAFFNMGYDFGWFDVAIRYTWRYLAEASAAQVQSLHAAAIEADNQLLFNLVMNALFSKVNRSAEIQGQDVNVYALYNNDGTVPPAYKTNTFDGTHDHYLTSGAAVVDSGDFDAIMEHLTHHGYNQTNGVQQIIAMNSAQGKVAKQFRIASGDTYDFIPSQSQATALILEPGQAVSGGRPASAYKGLNVIGSYGEALLVEDDLFPAGYIVAIGSGGPENLANPVGLREHANASLRGLRLVKGPDNNYPLTDSFYQRGAGTGIRQRGGSAVMQITASTTYTTPTQYAV